MSLQSQVSTELLIAGLSAVGSLIAVIFSIKSFRVSRKAYELANLQHSSTISKLSAYLADSFRAYNCNLEQGKFIFSIAFSNKSEAADSITEVSLETFFVNSKNRVSHLISSHEDNTNDWLPGEIEPAKLPINIQARSSETNWFVFSNSQVVDDAQRIEKYRVVARNAIGTEVAVESYVLREIEYEKNS